MTPSSASVRTYLITGALAGIILAFLHLYDVRFVFPYLFIVVYSTMFLLASSYVRPTWRLLTTTTVPVMLAIAPFIWHNAHASYLYLSMAGVSVYIINSFYMAYVQFGFKWNYHALFEAVWGTLVRVALAFLFSLLVAGILALWAGLFSVLGIEFFYHLFSQPWFMIIAASLSMSLGIYVTKLASTIVHSLRSLCLAFCFYLLPLVSAVSLLFVFALFISVVLMGGHFKADAVSFYWMSLLAILLPNGVYQDGSIALPYHRWVRYLVNTFLFISPLFSLLTLYAIFHSPGSWDIFSFLVLVSVLLLYNINYAVCVLCSRKKWLQLLGSCNIYLAVFFVIITLFFNVVPVNPAGFKHHFAADSSRSQMSPKIIKTFFSRIKETRFHWLPQGGSRGGVVLGFDSRKPLYVCKTRYRGHSYLGLVSGKYCHIILNNKIISQKSYHVLSGPAADVTWVGFYDAQYPVGAIAKTVPVSFSAAGENKTIQLCRTIYKNRLHLGFAKIKSFHQCRLEVAGTVQTGPGLQYLFVQPRKAK